MNHRWVRHGVATGQTDRRQLSSLCQTISITMKRITIRLPEQQVNLLEQMVDDGEFPTVSEAVRDAVRGLIERRGNRILRDKDQVSFKL